MKKYILLLASLLVFIVLLLFFSLKPYLPLWVALLISLAVLRQLTLLICKLAVFPGQYRLYLRFMENTLGLYQAKVPHSLPPSIISRKHSSTSKI